LSEPQESDVDKDLSSKLGIKPGSKICLVRPAQGIISQIRDNSSDVNIVVSGLEGECDVILCWFNPLEDIDKAMLELRKRIKPDGKIWVVKPKEEARQRSYLELDWQKIKEAALKVNLVDNKVVSINKAEDGTQFVSRKEYRNESE
jgi:hypothetical protein